MKCPVLTIENYSGQNKEILGDCSFLPSTTFFFFLILKNVVKIDPSERREKIIEW